MKNIKFRCRDIERKQFLHNSHAIRFDWQLIYLWDISREFEDYENTNEWHIIMQFTGRLDRKWTPIYEWDIVSIEFLDELWVVEFYDSMWRFVIIRDCWTFQDLQNVIEIKWNIYESPELFKTP